jgi:predicted secreted protein
MVVFGVVAASAAALSGQSPVLGPVDVRTDGLAFESGSLVALELAIDDGASCFPSGVDVLGFTVVDANGDRVVSVEVADPAPAASWLGAFALRDASGNDLPAGRYEVRVATTVGQFAAALDVTSAHGLRQLSRSASGASVCGVALSVYRLASEADAGSTLTLRVGDRLMVLLSGNPTTGYSWDNTLEYEYAVLRETHEAGFRADSDLLGAGGFFVFRYAAIDVGPQSFRFAYRRPWESVEPLQIVEFSVDVI